MTVSTLSAALPGAALRMTRTAAGRRALQVGLLVGGLFVLGLLCGERANAADGADSATSGVTATGVVRSVTGSAERVVTGSVGAVAQAVRQSRVELPGSEQRAATPDRSRAEASGAGASSGIGLSGLSGLVDLSAPSSEGDGSSEAEAGPAGAGAAPGPGLASGQGAAPGQGASPGSSSDPGVETPARPRTVDPLAPVRKATTQVTDPVSDGVHRVVRPVTEQAMRPVTEQVVLPATEKVIWPVTDQVIRPVTDQVIRPATDGVVRPIGGLVEQVVGAGTAESGAPGSPWWPPLSILPGLELPGLPHLPGPPVLPGQTLPVGSQPQVPGGAADEDGAAGPDAGAKSGDRSPGGYGPQFSGGHAAPEAGVHDNDEGARGAAQPPAHQEHEGAPRGALGHGSAADNGSPRHGDAHAVAFSNRAQLRLVPGIAAAVTAAETRDRYRDIPVFPG
ncbi:hypothetical protein [Streptomyces ureilyticus]|uniref:Secreted protein n=1 Tax=Streptomyces ureilyticus TaxID=1775131 RepID=A0ABX0E7D6_9ACTN|nr:hypothetical protein [Streptomyces ureilyticus]NGO48999.1 hypothetical protein [Streptomyces ureilyticus]